MWCTYFIRTSYSTSRGMWIAADSGDIGLEKWRRLLCRCIHNVFHRLYLPPHQPEGAIGARSRFVRLHSELKRPDSSKKKQATTGLAEKNVKIKSNFRSDSRRQSYASYNRWSWSRLASSLERVPSVCVTCELLRSMNQNATTIIIPNGVDLYKV